MFCNFHTYDCDCSYLTDLSTRQYSLYQNLVDEDENDYSRVFHLAYLEAKCYLGQDLTFDDLESSWKDKPSPWLDAILAKSGRKMSDWKRYWDD